MELIEEMKEADILDCNETVSKAIGELSRNRTCLVVTRNDNYFGIIDDWTITRFAPSSGTKIGSVAVRAPVISPKATLLEICKLFSSGPYRALPLIDGKKIIGVVPRNGILRMLIDANLIPRKKVSEVMSKNVPVMDWDASVAKAKSKIYGNTAGKLALIKNRVIIGVLTASDMAAALNKPKEKPPFVREKSGMDQIPITSLMRRDIHTISPEASLVETAKQMIEKDVAAIIVEKNMEPFGVIHARDLFAQAIAPEEPAVIISGLDGEDKQYTEDILADCRKFIKKISRSFPVNSFSLHFKKYGKKYSIHGKLETRRKSYAASVSGWDLQAILKTLIDDFKKVITKGKRSRLHSGGREEAGL